MIERRLSGWIAALAVLLITAVAWDLVMRRRPVRSAAPEAVAILDTPPPAAPSPLPRPDSPASQGAAVPPAADGPGYLELLARSETRRRIRASAGMTYLNEMLAASRDSMLRRWDNRIRDPVRVFLGPGTAANFRPSFLDAVRAAFDHWQAAAIPVRFDLYADSASAEVRFQWKIQFEIDRTGQTDLTWDQDGHLQAGTVTIATFDPKGRPMEADDIRVVALHEIGHLLGLDHSPDSTDVMFPVAQVGDLSDRDVRTAQTLYQLAPGSIR